MQLWSVQLHEGEFNLNRPSRPLLRTGSARNFQHLEQKQKVHPPPAGAKTKQRRFDPDRSPLWWTTERAPDATREGVTSRDYAHSNLNRAVNCFHI